MLLLLPFPPRLDAAHGGGRVTAELAGRLAIRHDLALLCLRGPDEAPVDEVLRGACAYVEEVPRPGIEGPLLWRWRRWARLAASQLTGRPIWATDWAVGAYARRVRSLAAAWTPDVVQVEYHIMGQYLPVLADCPAPRVLVEHDPGARAARDVRRLRRGYPRLIAELDALAWQRFERRLLRAVQAVVVFTEHDRRALAALSPTTPIVDIPLGTTWPERPLDPVGTPPLTLLFVGSFTHAPNLDAALRLARTIFPRVQERCPGVRLEIVGDKPPPELRRLASADLVVAGRVPQVQPYLQRAAVVLAPVRLGGGMRVKVLEALAAGKALVASPLAAEGLGVTDGQQLLLAEGDDQLVDAIVQLLLDPDRRARLAAAARAWAAGHLGWSRSVAAYEALYAYLVER